MNLATAANEHTISDQEYRRRINAWAMYDWANSAFATTILGAVLPIYFSQVAGDSLPSATVATSYWSFGLSLSLLIVAVISPVLGTVSDIMRGKKKFLAIFAGLGVMATALLVLVSTGDWLLASILGIIGRIGFNGANTFYDALLPHVARPEDRDRVSARGYAMGYLGGGILLAINVVMLQVLPGTWGARLSFVSVAIWWAIFTIPLLRRVPEPPAAVVKLQQGMNVLGASFRRLAETIRDIRQYRQLFLFLLSFLIYNDGIGTIIGVAAIYGAELGFGSVELVLALLLVQFVGIPYSLIFGRLPSKTEKRRPIFLAFILFNLVALPVVGICGAHSLPTEITGGQPAPFASTAAAVGEGIYLADSDYYQFSGDWQEKVILAETLGSKNDEIYVQAQESDTSVTVVFNGQKARITYSLGPDHGIWAVYIDGQPVLDENTTAPLLIDAYNPTVRYEVSKVIQAKSPGEHTLSLVNTAQTNAKSVGSLISLYAIEILPGIRQSNLLYIIGLILLLEVVGIAFSLLFGKTLFSRWVDGFTTKRTILLALLIYSVVAVWGYFLDSVIEFWFLAWMIAIVQGGSQALSRSLYSAMSPAKKSGEFFGLFGVMEKFSAIIGPLMFVAAGTLFGSSRPAVLSLIALFVIGGILLMFVNVEEGRQIAVQEDERTEVEGQML
jgi:MFS transporter, UMF1 family